MTHCGWNSLVEALQSGVAFVLVPFANDHGHNARLMAENKLGVEVPSKEDDGSFSGVDVAKALRLVMADKEGEEYRTRAKMVQEMLGNEEVHDRYVKDAVEFLKEKRATAKSAS
ncbi:unnamed protein product [Musa textilis]